MTTRAVTMPPGWPENLEVREIPGVTGPEGYTWRCAHCPAHLGTARSLLAARQEAIQHHNGLHPAPPLTRAEAKAKLLPGWNVRCNRCGTYGATWVRNERPGWGALALCPLHGAELAAEHARHQGALRRLRAVNFEQERDQEVAAREHKVVEVRRVDPPAAMAYWTEAWSGVCECGWESKPRKRQRRAQVCVEAHVRFWVARG